MLVFTTLYFSKDVEHRIELFQFGNADEYLGMGKNGDFELTEINRVFFRKIAKKLVILGNN